MVVVGSLNYVVTPTSFCVGVDNIVEHEDIMNHVLLVGHENLVSHISPDSLLDSTEKRMKLWKFCS